jgi:hypothetical protein
MYAPPKALFAAGIALAVVPGLAACSGTSAGAPPAFSQASSASRASGSVGAASLSTRHTASSQPLLYITDGQYVYVYNEVGKGQKPIQTIGGFSDAFGMAVAPNGDFYVADLGQQVVQVFHQGTTTPYETLTGAIEPAGVAIDNAGNVYANNWDGNEVYVWAPGYTTTTSTLVDQANPNGASNFLAVDAAGDVVVDYPGGIIDEFPAGQTTAIEIQPSAGVAEGMAFDGQQNLVVTNAGVGFNVYAPPYTGAPARKVKGRYEAQALAFTSDDSGLWMAVTNHKYGLDLSYPALKVVEKTSPKYLNTNIRGIAVYPPAPI